MTRFRLLRWAVVCTTTLIAACSFSFTTAHITTFTISKDEGGTQPATTFSPAESIFAKVTLGSVPGKIALKWQLVADKVEGFAEHQALPEADKSFELENPSFGGEATGYYSLKPPATGWPTGSYTIKVSMLDDAGTEKDSRSGSVTIVGGPRAAPQASAASNAPAAHDGRVDNTGTGDFEFSEPEFSESKHGEPADTFAADTAEIFMHVEFTGVPKGAKITATWVAQKVEGAAAQTSIASKDLTLGANATGANFSLTRPDKGWPIGSYRVDLDLDGRAVGSGEFEVEK